MADGATDFRTQQSGCNVLSGRHTSPKATLQPPLKPGQHFRIDQNDSGLGAVEPCGIMFRILTNDRAGGNAAATVDNHLV